MIDFYGKCRYINIYTVFQVCPEKGIRLLQSYGVGDRIFLDHQSYWMGEKSGFL